MFIENFNLDEKVFIIAELSANHANSLEVALKTIQAAKKAGADAIKIQTYTPDSLTLNSNKKDFIIKGGLWHGRKLYELYEEAKTPYEWHEKLFECAKNEGLICFSSPFSKQDVEFLRQFNPPAYKIASFEVNDYDFVRFIAKENKPTLVSTGIAYEEELEMIAKIFQEENNPDLILLKCTSAYPSQICDLNLNAIKTLQEKFKTTVGLSDHSEGFLAPVLAVALGARVIEKHFILDKTLNSADAKFSLDFEAFKQMCDMVRKSEQTLGDVSLAMDEKTLKNRHFARSLYASKDIKKGEIFTLENVKSVRPSLGLHPKFLPIILGKKANCNIEFGTALEQKHFKG
ncbi:pseudaminic acid synthase [Campylobacter subantarcticus LMG 24377]|uniref:Pseudaminic acid synthase n=2 Tax=Campylobacter subantarcticus TaxID=497724 RepID=A0A0A8H7M6_9BACT|nr:pseudaminic acid synthase [Campylobacter subantarcticus]EAJ1261367.1 pseudaminic acid synthase [Campylobacter lari]AJC90076.1 pseudaminic acid synthase [Campylobacter subantarcticus LMG 24374]AJC91743.1 pseudaminic acid synthase [Campylobacter subantarcticus LMG 24377]EAL3939191.1 pseudaminic acid synthase [Campylobacter lari]MPC00072.1 pseudaminic acid synthase [Campylobacter subantarcticus]